MVSPLLHRYAAPILDVRVTELLWQMFKEPFAEIDGVKGIFNTVTVVLADVLLQLLISVTVT